MLGAMIHTPSPLSPQFLAESRRRLAELRAVRAASTVDLGAEGDERVEEATTTASCDESSPPATPGAEDEPPAPCDERVVTVSSRKSERAVSVESLRKLARARGLALPRNATREVLLALLEESDALPPQ